MKLTQQQIEENDYLVFVVVDNKPRYVRFPIEVDSEAKLVKYNIIVALNIPDMPFCLEKSLKETAPELQEVEAFEERTFTGSFFVLDGQDKKILEVL